MCDGQREEILWTIQVRSTGQPLETRDGYTFVFDDEDAARSFLDGRSDAAALEIVRLASPQLA